MYGCEIMFITRLLKCPTARSLLLVSRYDKLVCSVVLVEDMIRSSLFIIVVCDRTKSRV